MRRAARWSSATDRRTSPIRIRRSRNVRGTLRRNSSPAAGSLEADPVASSCAGISRRRDGVSYCRIPRIHLQKRRISRWIGARHSPAMATWMGGGTVIISVIRNLHPVFRRGRFVLVPFHLCFPAMAKPNSACSSDNKNSLELWMEPRLGFVFESRLKLAPRFHGKSTAFGGSPFRCRCADGEVRGAAPRCAERCSITVEFAHVRNDGVFNFDALFRAEQDGTLIYLQNRGYRHGPPDVMERLYKLFFALLGDVV